MEHAKWRFVSNFDKGGEFAYVVVSWKRLNGTDPTSMRFGYDDFRGGRWRYLARTIQGQGFPCGTAQLLNPNWEIDVQIRMIKTIAKCIA